MASVFRRLAFRPIRVVWWICMMPLPTGSRFTTSRRLTGSTWPVVPGNQYKNAPIAGKMMAALVEYCEGGNDHDVAPLTYRLPYIQRDINVGFARVSARSTRRAASRFWVNPAANSILKASYQTGNVRLGRTSVFVVCSNVILKTGSLLANINEKQSF